MDDAILAAVCIADEAAGQPYEGKVAVGRVIRNRMALKYASDGTVAGTVLRPLQFSGFWFAMEDGVYRRTEWTLDGAEEEAATLLAEFSRQAIWADCKRAWRDSAPGCGFAGGPQYRKLDGEAVLYFNPRICAAPPWANPHDLEAVIFQHSFFRA